MGGTGYIGLGDGPGRQLRLSLPHPCGFEHHQQAGLGEAQVSRAAELPAGSVP